MVIEKWMDGWFSKKNRKKENQRFPSYNLFSKDCKGQFFRKNRKGWIRIVEAFISILLVTIVLLVVLDKTQIEKVDSSNIADAEASILREIQLDNELRNEILGIDPITGGVEWGGFPAEKIPNNLDCTAKICEMGGLCVLQGYPEKDVYSESVIITTTLQVTTFNPRVLKMFCWSK